MVVIQKQNIANIPLLEVVKEDLLNSPLPTVIFVHGFTSAKEHNLHYAYLLADKNIRVLLPEADFHGERARSIEKHELAVHFWEIIIRTIEELNLIKNEYVQMGKTMEDNIGLAGTSMGGIVTLGALTQYNWVKSAVSLMGCPSYVEFAHHLVEQIKNQGEKLPFTEEELENELKKIEPYDLSKQPNKVNNRPLLFWHGKKDPVVPFSYAYQFYKQLKDEHPESPQHLQFIAEENAEHKVSREGLLATVKWFETYLSN